MCSGLQYSHTLVLYGGHRYISILINSAAVCALMLFDFEAILEANMVTYNLKLVLEFAALLKLRQSEPDLERPYKIPLELPGLCALFAPPVLLTLALLVLASWATLGIAACVVGLGFLAHFVRTSTMTRSTGACEYNRPCAHHICM